MAKPGRKTASNHHGTTQHHKSSLEIGLIEGPQYTNKGRHATLVPAYYEITRDSPHW